MLRFLFFLLLSFIFGGAAPLASAWAGDVNSCIDQCFSSFRPPADCPACTGLRDQCLKQCSKVGPSYGAIAYGRTSGAWGSSYQWDSRAKAESTAMQTRTRANRIIRHNPWHLAMSEFDTAEYPASWLYPPYLYRAARLSFFDRSNFRPSPIG